MADGGRVSVLTRREWGTRAGATAADAADPSSLLRLLLLTSLAVGVARRLALSWSEPLWLDEIFTGTIAIRPDLPALIEDILHELGGPVYYGLIWAWEKVAGSSNVALRLPSLLFAVAAPLVILWRGHPDKIARWIWASLLILWLPAISYAAEARSYTLLLLLGCLQTISFRRLIEQPSLREATIWSALASLMVLTHYHSLVLVGLQGIAFLVVYGAVALRTWPAGLIFVPVAAFMWFHLPNHFAFAAVAWHNLLDPAQIPMTVAHLLVGLGWAGMIPLATFVLILLSQLLQRMKNSAPWPYSRSDVLAVGTSLAATGFIITLGYLKPSFSPRYLIGYMPGFLLGLALVFDSFRKRWSHAPAALISFMLFFALVEFVGSFRQPVPGARRGYSWEDASAYLQAEGVERLIFLWDNPSVVGAYKPLLFRTGTFYFDRADQPVVPDGVLLQGTDEQLRSGLLAAASTPVARQQKVGILLLGRPLDLDDADKRWRCRRYGGPNFGVDVYVTACSRPPIGMQLQD